MLNSKSSARIPATALAVTHTPFKRSLNFILKLFLVLKQSIFVFLVTKTDSSQQNNTPTKLTLSAEKQARIDEASELFYFFFSEKIIVLFCMKDRKLEEQKQLIREAELERQKRREQEEAERAGILNLKLKN